MAGTTRRLQVLAGPNGSGKSTLAAAVLHRSAVFVNADEIERTIRQEGALSLMRFGLRLTTTEVRARLEASPFVRTLGLDAFAAQARVVAGTLHVPAEAAHPYLAAALAEMIREALVAVGRPFAFETVMSSPDKIDLMRRARERGFRVELTYVSTVDPVINVNRVAVRVAQGGHPVPEAKIVSRYHRSLANLADAIRASDVARLYDNSGREVVVAAEVRDGRTFAFPNGRTVPWWVARYAWEPLQTPAHSPPRHRGGRGHRKPRTGN